MSKQDRQGARTVSDLERRLNYGERFNEVMGIAVDARNTANQAMYNSSNPAAKLTQDEVFNLLTNNGANQGIYRDENGEIYVNASYLKSGIIDASLIKTGILQSADGSISIDLLNNSITVTTNIGGKPGEILIYPSGIVFRGLDATTGEYRTVLAFDPGYVGEGGTAVSTSIGTPYSKVPLLIYTNQNLHLSGETVRLSIGGAGKTLSWKDNGDGTYTLIGT